MSKRRGKRRGLACELDELLKGAKRARKVIEAESVAQREVENDIRDVVSVDGDSSHQVAPQETTSGNDKTPATHDCRRRSNPEAELLDVLGINGYVALVQAIQHVPDGFLTYRNQYIANILTIATRMDIQASDVKHYIEMLHEANTSIAPGKLPVDLLWKATFEYDFPHTLFLAPPVITCLHCAGTLQIHHAPSVIICYTLEGPLPAAKITLRCRHCGINYR